jgi:hypothetical protein
MSSFRSEQVEALADLVKKQTAKHERAAEYDRFASYHRSDSAIMK